MEVELPIYLDNSATTALDPRVLETMLPYFKAKFGNASSMHPFGWVAQEAVDRAREQVATLINATAQEIVFTSGATESDNLAIKGVYEVYAAQSGGHVISCSTEHRAVLDTCRHLEQLGARVSYIGVDAAGLIDLEALEAAISPETVLIAVMYANNETGVLQPVREISAIARRHGILFFTDATQAVGKVPVDVQKDGIDLMAFSAHKLYGPKGVGALYVRRRDPRVRIAAQTDGGGQERGRRSGTLNVPAIAGFGKACALCAAELEPDARRLGDWRNLLEKNLLENGAARVNGYTAPRLPQVSNISFAGISGKGLVAAFHRTIALSAGSACSAALPEPSYVLKAMGLTEDLAFNALRFSLGRFNTEAEINYTLAAVNETINRLSSGNTLKSHSSN